VLPGAKRPKHEDEDDAAASAAPHAPHAAPAPELKWPKREDEEAPAAAAAPAHAAPAPNIKREDDAAADPAPLPAAAPPPGAKWLKKEDEDDNASVAAAVAAAAAAAAAAAPPFAPPLVPPAPVPRYGPGLGATRQDRKRNFMFGVAADEPPHVRCGKLPPPKVGTHEQIHAQLSVAFADPYKPTPPQLQVMKTLGDALMSGVHAIVEAPTGTGKTAAVMMPLLAFQAQQFEAYGASDPGAVPRIIYVARTLPQLDNTCKELASYLYSVLAAAPVAKEHLCMLPEVPGLSRADQCRAACKPLSKEELQKLPGRKTRCEFFDKQNAVDLPESRIDDYYLSEGALAGRSIEELVAGSRTEGVCAFHVSRDLAQTAGANVLLLSYNQLFDPHLRACNKTDALLKGALVFVDEAHNVPSVCREAASESLNMAQLRSLRDEGDSQLQSLRGLLGRMRMPACRLDDEHLNEKLVNKAIGTVEAMRKLISYLSNWLDTAAKARHKWETDEPTQTAHFSGESAQELIVGALLDCGALCNADFGVPAAASAAWPAAPGAPAAAGVASPAVGLASAASGVASPAAGVAATAASVAAPAVGAAILTAAGLASPAPSPVASPAPPHAASPAPSPAVARRRLLQSRVKAAREALADFADKLNTVDAALTEAGHRTSAASSHHRNPTGRFGALLSKLSMCVSAQADCYALVLRRQSPRAIAAERAKPASARHDTSLPQLDIVCLTATVAMQRVLELASCAVFATGTLGPVPDFACEIGLDDGYRAVSTEHHASVRTQLLPLVYAGRHGKLRLTAGELKASFGLAPGASVIDEAGEVLLRCAPHIAGGILCFFGSKSACRTFTDRWQNDGTLARLAALLPRHNALVIDDADDSDASKANIAKYCEFAGKPSANGGPTAIMFAALRGRASEGTDFKDGLARGVFVFSVPLPPWKDPSLVAKMEYNDRMGRPLPPGERWYLSEAVRCAAQAVGRVIRHAGDHGVAVLLDCRYAPQRPGSVNALLPHYLRGLLQVDTSVDALAAKLPPFFARCAALAPPPPPPPPAGVKRET
jgi:Rad3-related DNA helicase